MQERWSGRCVMGIMIFRNEPDHDGPLPTCVDNIWKQTHISAQQRGIPSLSTILEKDLNIVMSSQASIRLSRSASESDRNRDLNKTFRIDWCTPSHVRSSPAPSSYSDSPLSSPSALGPDSGQVPAASCCISRSSPLFES